MILFNIAVSITLNPYFSHNSFSIVITTFLSFSLAISFSMWASLNRLQEFRIVGIVLIAKYVIGIWLVCSLLQYFAILVLRWRNSFDNILQHLYRCLTCSMSYLHPCNLHLVTCCTLSLALLQGVLLCCLWGHALFLLPLNILCKLQLFKCYIQVFLLSE